MATRSSELSQQVNEEFKIPTSETTLQRSIRKNSSSTKPHLKKTKKN